MTTGQILATAIILATIALFLWGRWRHDVIALAALLATVAAGLTPPEAAFTGFANPAVITVACVLVLSAALQSTGGVDAVARALMPKSAGLIGTIAALTVSAAILSAFMNNVGALALLMPIALQMASRLSVPPGRLLMPLAFGSILGGMTTLIGTPPNLIVAGFRAETLGSGFSMFDFTPVGLAVALFGVAFIVFFGWRLVPARERSGVESFETSPYFTEARVPKDAKAVGMSLQEVELALGELEAQVVGLVRHERRIAAPARYLDIRSGDILVIEAEPEGLAGALDALGLVLEEGQEAESNDESSKLQADDIVLSELVVRQRSDLVGRSAADVHLRTRYNVNLLAISREGNRSAKRLRSTAVQQGDVLLVQGTMDAISDFASNYGCVPLAERALRLPDRRKALTAFAIMAAAIGGAAFGLLPAAIAFAGGVLAVVVFGVTPANRLYDAIDWPVVVLLGALIPVANALSESGAAEVFARLVMDNLAGGNAVVALVIVLIATMTLSDFMNNAATAAVMCPIALGVAGQLGVNSDPYLMAVAVGASCAFLTPIGHQNNTLILGPGGFRFGDYWKLGAPLEVVVVIVAVPMILIIWPL